MVTWVSKHIKEMKQNWHSHFGAKYVISRLKFGYWHSAVAERWKEGIPAMAKWIINNTDCNLVKE